MHYCFDCQSEAEIVSITYTGDADNPQIWNQECICGSTNIAKFESEEDLKTWLLEYGD